MVPSAHRAPSPGRCALADHNWCPSCALRSQCVSVKLFARNCQSICPCDTETRGKFPLAKPPPVSFLNRRRLNRCPCHLIIFFLPDDLFTVLQE
jgi:hypothetical protein